MIHVEVYDTSGANEFTLLGDASKSCSLHVPAYLVAKHFNIELRYLRIAQDSTGTYLNFVDGFFQTPHVDRAKEEDDMRPTYLRYTAYEDAEDEQDVANFDCASKVSNGSSAKEEEEHAPHYEQQYLREYSAFLRHGEYPVRMDGNPGMRKNFKKRVKRKYKLEGKHLIETRGDRKNFKCDIKNTAFGGSKTTRLCVPSREEMLAIVKEYHYEGHPRLGKMEAYLQTHFKFDGMREVCTYILQLCETCYESIVSMDPAATQAIISSRVLQRVLFDFFTMPFPTPAGYKHVLLLRCHFTKYLWAKAFKRQLAKNVAMYLAQVFADRPIPEIFHSDNGSPFVNAVIHELLLLMGNPLFIHGRAMHPQSQGLIENGVRQQKKMLKKNVSTVIYCFFRRHVPGT